eukprot:403346402
MKSTRNGTFLEALIISCNQYDNYESLKPAMDLRRVNNFLKDNNFNCQKLMNPTLNDVEQQIRDVHENLPTKSDSLFLIYFSGMAKSLSTQISQNIQDSTDESKNQDEPVIIQTSDVNDIQDKDAKNSKEIGQKSKIIYKQGQKIIVKGDQIQTDEQIARNQQAEMFKNSLIQASKLREQDTVLQLVSSQNVEEFTIQDILQKVGYFTSEELGKQQYNVIVILDVIQEGLLPQNHYDQQVQTGSWISKISGSFREIKMLNKTAEIKDMDILGRSQGSYFTELFLAYFDNNTVSLVGNPSTQKNKLTTQADRGYISYIEPLFQKVEDQRNMKDIKDYFQLAKAQQKQKILLKETNAYGYIYSEGHNTNKTKIGDGMSLENLNQQELEQVELVNLLKSDKVNNSFVNEYQSLMISEKMIDLKIEYFNISTSVNRIINHNANQNTQNSYIGLYNKSFVTAFNIDTDSFTFTKSWYEAPIKMIKVDCTLQRLFVLFEDSLIEIYDISYNGNYMLFSSRINHGGIVTAIESCHENSTLIIGTNLGYLSQLRLTCYNDRGSDYSHVLGTLVSTVGSQNSSINHGTPLMLGITDMRILKDDVIAIMGNYVNIYELKLAQRHNAYLPAYNLIHYRSISFDFDLSRITITYGESVVVMDTFNAFILGKNFQSIKNNSDPYMQEFKFEAGMHTAFEERSNSILTTHKYLPFFMSDENNVYLKSTCGDIQGARIISTNFEDCNFIDGPRIIHQTDQKHRIVVPITTPEGTFLAFYEIDEPLYSFIF